jgi:hypothetical protein
MFGPKILLSTLTEDEKDELLKLVLQELIHTVKDTYPTEKRTTVLSVEVVHDLIKDTIQRLNYYNQPTQK